jgi:hypothetical protein
MMIMTPIIRTSLLIAAAMLPALLEAQCTYTGLSSNYCSSAPAVTLTPSVPGGSFSGTGVSGSVFTPSVAGPGTHTITYLTCSGNYTIASGTYSFINTGGTGLSLMDDEVSTAVPIGFSFNFFCVNYDSLYVSSNGFITFSNNNADGCCSGDSLPNFTIPDNLVAFAWADLDPSSSGVITYTTIGTSPNRKMLVTFSGVDHFSNFSTVTSQVQLFEGSNVIEIHTTSMQTDFSDHTMGIENAGGTVGFGVPARNGNSSWSAFNDMQRFTPQICTSSQTTSVTGPTITASTSAATVCAGSSATLLANGAVTYTWNGSAPGSSAVVTPASNTTYTVTGHDANSCIAQATVAVSVAPLPTVSLAGPTGTICSGTTLTLTASGASTYSWSTSATGSLVTVTPTSTAVYTATGTTQSCSSTSTISVNVDPGPTVTASVSAPVVCTPMSATLTGTGANNYTWTTSTGTPSNTAVIVVNRPAGTYTYTLAGANAAGCMNSRNVSFTVSACTRLGEMLPGHGITIYPNPSRGTFMVESESDSEILLFDNLGRLVRSFTLDAQKGRRITVSDLAPGVYLVADMEKNFQAKVIVEK